MMHYLVGGSEGEIADWLESHCSPATCSRETIYHFPTPFEGGTPYTRLTLSDSQGVGIVLNIRPTESPEIVEVSIDQVAAVSFGDNLLESMEKDAFTVVSIEVLEARGLVFPSMGDIPSTDQTPKLPAASEPAQEPGAATETTQKGPGRYNLVTDPNRKGEMIYRIGKAQEARRKRKAKPCPTWRDVAKDIGYCYGADKKALSMLSEDIHRLERLEKEDPTGFLAKIAEIRKRKRVAEESE
jgi:hypothetical protein